MADIKSPRLLYLKGGLLLAVGLIASALLVAEHPTAKVALLLAIAVWGFARAYYFAFYVIEHYVDGSYRFAGLIDFIRYAMGRRGASDHSHRPGP
ncbi:hypothetical protein P12x_000389 [Tundrisphaera lichenicola]|uniref:hypothetical protein n=1 Tax=Tundrisphaera lichenicola TaxID=2029860 RepID=UPI003EBC387E